MLNLWRRHVKACPHRARTYRKCGCPIWVQGTLQGKWIKKSLDLRNWESAQKLVRDWESGTVTSLPLNEACERFQADCEARNIGPAQLGKYKLLIEELKNEFGERTVSTISPDDLRRFREGWTVGPVTAFKKIERLRTFFRFCHDSNWIQQNPARVIRPPRREETEKTPFTASEMERILWAIEVYPDRPGGRRKQLKAFVDVLRYSGLRIGDVVRLSKDSFEGNKIRIHAQKTHAPVFVPVPQSIVLDLEMIRPDGGHYFWSGEGQIKSCVGDWQRSLTALLKLANVKGSAHKFRHTFATTLLQKGVSTEMVAKLLGHRDIRITQRHYSHWIAERQAELEAAVQKVWN